MAFHLASVGNCTPVCPIYPAQGMYQSRCRRPHSALIESSQQRIVQSVWVCARSRFNNLFLVSI